MLKMKSTYLILLASAFVPASLASGPCPLHGPAWPSPSNITGDTSIVKQAWGDTTRKIDALVSGGANSTFAVDFSAHTFSIGVFSTKDSNAQELFQYHHTGPTVANATKGVQKVDADSVYRIGSLSKLLTAYLHLIEVGSMYWDLPVTDFIPELKDAAQNSTQQQDFLDYVGWNSVTLGALAGQISGLGRDPANLIEELAVILPLELGKSPTAVGFPPIDNATAMPVCMIKGTDPCTREQFFQEINQRGPAYLPWTSPVYSNFAFELLAMALETITGRPFEGMFNERLVDALGLSGTSYMLPSDFNLSRAVIPGGDPTSLSNFFAVNIGNESAAGGMYSTLNDVNKLGVSMLNSSLLCPEETRKWMQPITHTASLHASVGRPWEIHRFVQPATARVNDLYTKEGDLGAYSSFLVLSPDHDAGFSILAAGPETSLVVNWLAETLTNSTLVGFEAQAAAEARLNLAGTYGAGDSSITLVVPPSGAGLQVADWTSNGAPVLQLLRAGFKYSPDVRLYPTNVVRGNLAAFRAVYVPLSFTGLPGGAFLGELGCSLWESVDSKLYGKKPLDEFVFEMGADGVASSVTNAAFRARLSRA